MKQSTLWFSNHNFVHYVWALFVRWQKYQEPKLVRMTRRVDKIPYDSVVVVEDQSEIQIQQLQHFHSCNMDGEVPGPCQVKTVVEGIGDILVGSNDFWEA